MWSIHSSINSWINTQKWQDVHAGTLTFYVSAYHCLYYLQLQQENWSGINRVPRDPNLGVRPVRQGVPVAVGRRSRSSRSWPPASNWELTSLGGPTIVNHSKSLQIKPIKKNTRYGVFQGPTNIVPGRISYHWNSNKLLYTTLYRRHCKLMQFFFGVQINLPFWRWALF